MILIIIRSSYNASYNNQFIRERDGVRKSGKPDKMKEGSKKRWKEGTKKEGTKIKCE